MTSRRTRLSSSICQDVLRVLDRIYALVGPDEPDLGLNVAYVTASASLRRLASAEPWLLPANTASAIHGTIAAIVATTDPVELEAQLVSFPAWVIRTLDRRTAEGGPPKPGIVSRRAGDRIRLTQVYVRQGVLVTP